MRGRVAGQMLTLFLIAANQYALGIKTIAAVFYDIYVYFSFTSVGNGDLEQLS